MRRLFGLTSTPRVAHRQTPFLRGPSGDTWQEQTSSLELPPVASPVSPERFWAPINTVTNQDDIHELVNKIRLASTGGTEDRLLILDVCDRTSTDATAREAVRALMHEFNHGSPDAQLSAARLWAILLRNSSAAFISQSTAADFLETIERLIVSSNTSPVVRHRVLRVLGDAVYSNPTRDEFCRLWMMVKTDDYPEQVCCV
ncbi:hypothetical protein C8J57DRAFT_685206 [Mycena rebaudengoi]|nr:hypothetical protein C8J57DRAFT_685206 [Mycena rebaudengoi]